MPIYKGTTEIENILKGTTEIQAVYQGTIQKWSNLKVIDLGTNTSFNVRSIYPNYNELSVDDFFFTDCPISWSDAAHCPDWDGSSCQGSHDDRSVSGSMTKTYSNGVLTCYYKVGNSTYNVHAFLIPKSNKHIGSKIVDLGTTNSYDLRQLPNYQSITTNNIFYRTLPNSSDGISCYSYRCEYGISFTKRISNYTLSTYISQVREGTKSVQKYFIESRYL